MKRDLRAYARQTNRRLVIGALVLLFVVGLGLIAWFYGPGGALTGLLCLLGAMLPVGLVWLFTVGLDRIVRRINR